MTHLPSRPSPGAIALLAMGWLELIVSLTTFLLRLYLVALAFAVASALLAWVAAEIRGRPSAAGSPRPVAPPPTPSPILRAMFWASAGLAAAALIGAAIWLIQGRGLNTLVFALWAASLGIQAMRLRRRT